jgi:hypothetical protein
MIVFRHKQAPVQVLVPSFDDAPTKFMFGTGESLQGWELSGRAACLRQLSGKLEVASVMFQCHMH